MNRNTYTQGSKLFQNQSSENTEYSYTVRAQNTCG